MTFLPAFVVAALVPLAAVPPPTAGSVGGPAPSDAVLVRFRVHRPAAAPGEKLHVVVGGFRHDGPSDWYLPRQDFDVHGNTWSAWFAASPGKPLHGRLDREGGVAEWPAMTLTVTHPALGPLPPETVAGCAFDVQLADRPAADAVVITSSETSESNVVAFLLPHPLRAHRREFETGSQMLARQLAWAKQAAGPKPIALHLIDVYTSLFSLYDPAIERAAVEALRWLGVNGVAGARASARDVAHLRDFDVTWHIGLDPQQSPAQWERTEVPRLARSLPLRDGKLDVARFSHIVISDEIKNLDFNSAKPGVVDPWFRDELRRRGVRDDELPRPIAEIEFPAKALTVPSLPRDADLRTRRLLYEAAKFEKRWTVQQLRQTTDLAKASFPGMKTATMPSSHGFLDAWGPPYMGMSAPLLDWFEFGAQRPVDILTVEDWLGLNHMYGPDYTWTGAQSYGYLNALFRSALGDSGIAQMALITPSDEHFLLLKAYSAFAQGAHKLNYWAFGPTTGATENYFSDLHSEYAGIARLGHALEGDAERIVVESHPARDPVAILYSVSHDLWFTDNPAAFVEKRLLWHALRHLGVQPDFVREEDLEQGRLKDYRVLYVVDWCVTQKASAAIDAWVKAGGVVYLSAGAATRDELAEPRVPPFAAAVYPDAAATRMKSESHAYNERVNLPTLAPMTTARVALDGNSPFSLPVLGARLDLRAIPPTPTKATTDGDTVHPLATFDTLDAGNTNIAGAVVDHGRGHVVALGFLPMLAYAQLAGFKPTTMEEHWPESPRRLVRLPLELAGIHPVAQTNVPVVESGLLVGPHGSAVVLANYTYRPIANLQVDLQPPAGVHWARARSARHGVLAPPTETPDGRVHLQLPLDDVDLILLD